MHGSACTNHSFQTSWKKEDLWRECACAWKRRYKQIKETNNTEKEPEKDQSITEDKEQWEQGRE